MENNTSTNTVSLSKTNFLTKTGRKGERMILDSKSFIKNFFEEIKKIEENTEKISSSKKLIDFMNLKNKLNSQYMEINYLIVFKNYTIIITIDKRRSKEYGLLYLFNLSDLLDKKKLEILRDDFKIDFLINFNHKIEINRFFGDEFSSLKEENFTKTIKEKEGKTTYNKTYSLKFHVNCFNII